MQMLADEGGSSKNGKAAKEAPSPDVMDRGLRRVRDLLGFIHRKFDFGPKRSDGGVNSDVIRTQLAGKGRYVPTLVCVCACT
jgi:hypothetical protein